MKKYLILFLFCFWNCVTSGSNLKTDLDNKNENKCDQVEYEVKMDDCYWSMATVLFFPVYDETTHEIIEVVPAPITGEGCRCVYYINDFPFVSTEPMSNSFCADQVPPWLRN